MATLDISNPEIDVTATAGKTWSLSLAYTDSAGTVVPLSTASWALRESFGGTAVLSAGTATYITMGTAGDFTMTLPGTVTSGVAEGQYVHEFEWTTTGGDIVGASGTWIVKPEAVK
jgi:hypothetical protein